MSSEDQCLRRTRYSDHPDIPEKCPFTHGATDRLQRPETLTRSPCPPSALYLPCSSSAGFWRTRCSARK
ncbi:hypothetical protein F2P79_004968 [Pimephales promelas]|nr:hypothetical protein F2P79_004968 [Pimephales promelas]